MTTQEHLDKIVAKIDQLLELAEKRTPGEWNRPSQCATHIICENSRNYGKMICDCPDSTPDCSQHGPDAAFIAACAGPAEAGWRATKAAIQGLQVYANIGGPLVLVGGDARATLEEIISAWPEELL